jgi:uncharacterized protein YbjQ (UPF0145 family)
VTSAALCAPPQQAISQKVGEAKETAAGYMQSAAEKLGAAGQAEKKQ